MRVNFFFPITIMAFSSPPPPILAICLRLIFVSLPLGTDSLLTMGMNVPETTHSARGRVCCHLLCNLGSTCSLFISTALVALFNVQVGLEDAFVAGNDGIDLQIWKDGLRQQLDALEDPVVLEWDNRKKD